MNSTLALKAGAFAAVTLIGSYLLAAEDISPQLADSAKARRDREVSLVSDNPPSSRRRTARTGLALKAVKALREELHARLMLIEAQLRELSASGSSTQELKVELEKVIQNEKKIGQLLKRLESGSEGR